MDINKTERPVETPFDSTDYTADSSSSSSSSSSFDPRADLAAAVELAGRTLAAVRPGQYDAPTPCEEFDVRRLSSHLVAVVRRISVIGRGKDPFSVPSFADEVADGGWAAAWEPAAREVGVPVRTVSPAANGGDQSLGWVGRGSSAVIVASVSAWRPPFSSGT
ncbi:maleylpyruvate isomerase N-terminal domain-containing protein [Streptomyces sp. C]|uniref:maleylpyruvate isomerase N-terminal domain-containing protein n=1 Tax=Streptomyces sp. C TaxID=253839 RepID=UPI0001B4CE17|nr:maleylpyruvate isomerase N-terminal domain-containing protein [Streptomyces sp. C]